MSQIYEQKRTRNENDRPEVENLPRSYIKNTISTDLKNAQAQLLEDEQFSKNALESYYSKYFPVSSLFQWLNPFSTHLNDTHRREFCLILRTPVADEVFCRFQCLPTKEALRQALIRENHSESIIRMEIGPIYNDNVTKVKNSVDANAVERELVFDIDMDDYDSIRTCCSGKKVCNHCFQYLAAAAKVLDRSLRVDFGFKHILFVFSGRRGLHCWVSDKRARLLKNEGRAAIVNYLSLDKNEILKTSFNTLQHPSIAANVELLADIFPDLIARQTFFSTLLSQVNLLNRASDKSNTNASTAASSSTNATNNTNSNNATTLLEPWPQEIGALLLQGNREGFHSDAIWSEIVKICKKHIQKPNTPVLVQNQIQTMLDRIVLHYLYPRLDIEVSKQTNHLLKAPFCVHPATGKVCVPIDLDTIDDFDVNAVPTLADLMREIREFSTESQTDENGAPVLIHKRSILTPYLEFFDKFAQNLAQSNQTPKPTSASKKMNQKVKANHSDMKDEIDW